MIYIASNYTSHLVQLEEWRYRQVLAYTARLLRNRQWCYSPIVHCHELAKAHQLPTDYAYWMDYNKHVIDRCSELFVLALPDWGLSKGVRAEIDWWEKMRGALKPSAFINWGPSDYTDPYPSVS